MNKSLNLNYSIYTIQLVFSYRLSKEIQQTGGREAMQQDTGDWPTQSQVSSSKYLQGNWSKIFLVIGLHNPKYNLANISKVIEVKYF